MNFINMFTAKTKLTSTEIHLLEWINRNPEKFIIFTIQEISKLANCSASAITRLTKKMKFSSLKNMQIQAKLKHSEIINEFNIVDKEGIKANISNLNTYHSYSIRETLREVNEDDIKFIVDKILRSNKILLFGVGSSKRACQELSSNLVKIGYNAIFYEDLHLQLLNIPILQSDDLIIIFSKSCKTIEVQFFIEMCYRENKPIIVLTSNENFVNKDKVTKILTFATYEQPHRITAISSKVSQLIFADLIYIEVFNKNYDLNIEYINKGNDLINEWNKKCSK